MYLTKNKTLKNNIKDNRPDLLSNAFQLASHVVQGSLAFLDLSPYNASAVLSSMLSFSLQRFTGNE